jgi:hypothetical protein
MRNEQWTGEDLYYLARLKDSDNTTLQTVCDLILEGHLEKDTFRRIVSCSPAWFMRDSYHLHRMQLLPASSIERVSVFCCFICCGNDCY